MRRCFTLILLTCLVIISGFLHTVAFDDFDEIQEDYDDEVPTEPDVREATIDVQPASVVDNTDLWDEDEFEGFDTPAQEQEIPSAGQKQAAAQKVQAVRKPAFIQQEHYYFEVAALLGLVLYGINVWFGKSANEKIAIAWARAFCAPGAIMERNFSLLGPGESGEILMKESHSLFKFYASGRRYCQGMLATIDLRARQDVFSLVFYLWEPRKDWIDFEVFMNDSSMTPMVLAIATPQAAKTLLNEMEDVKTFTHSLTVTKDRQPKWTTQPLEVLTESNALFYELFKDPFFEQVFSEQSYTLYSKYFRYLHFTSENTQGSHSKVLRFSFNLPAVEEMDVISKLMTLVTHCIDVVGAYQPSPDVKKRAEKLRLEQDKKAFQEKRKEREEQLAQKRAQKEKEALAKMGPEARRKWEDKQSKIAQRRSGRMKALRM